MVMEKIGNVAYKLQLPLHSQIHPVFHVSLLKRKIGLGKVACHDLPILGPDGQPKLEPVHVLERRLVKRKNKPVVQWLVQWSNLSVDEATWEDAEFVTQQFPDFQP